MVGMSKRVSEEGVVGCGRFDTFANFSGGLGEKGVFTYAHL